MIHRLALFMGGTGAAGVLVVALALGGFGAAVPNGPDAFVPLANDSLGGGQRAAEAPTEQPTAATSLGGGSPQDAPKKVIDTVYVVPASTPAVHHSGKPASDADQPTDPPRNHNNDGNHNDGNNNGANQAGDDQGDDSSAGQDNEDDHGQAGEDDHSNDDHSDDGGQDDGGYEPGDD